MKTILRGSKDPKSDLWTLPIFSLGGQWTTPGHTAMVSTTEASPSQPGPCKCCASLTPSIHPEVEIFSSILTVYKMNFEYLVSKGYKPKINIMDNQATKAIKSYLKPQECKLQLVKPVNHRVNAAEHAIQTFKNRFIGALGTTNVDFPIQLWDKMPPQVQDAINLVRCSRINPNNSAYEALEGPYNWNWYPLAPLCTKAVIYEDADTRASWGPYGLVAWLLRPSKDHYQCNLYKVPETKGYCISGSANLFPQHCITPAFTPVTHVQELLTELQDTLATMGHK